MHRIEQERSACHQLGLSFTSQLEDACSDQVSTDATSDEGKTDGSYEAIPCTDLGARLSEKSEYWSKRSSGDVFAETKACRRGLETACQQLLPSLKKDLEEHLEAVISERMYNMVVPTLKIHLEDALTERVNKMSEELRCPGVPSLHDGGVHQGSGAISREELGAALRRESAYWSERCLGEISNFECVVDAKLAKHEVALEEKLSSRFLAIAKDLQELKKEANTAKLTWSTSHDVLTAGMRKLMAQVNEATPSQLTSQMNELKEEVDAAKLTWTTAHTALTGDMRELMGRFNEATPLKLSLQFNELADEVNKAKLTWSTAHTAMTGDMRELMGRFNKATPLELASQLNDLRQELALEVKHRNDSVQDLSKKMQGLLPGLAGLARLGMAGSEAALTERSSGVATQRSSGVATPRESKALMNHPDSLRLKGRPPMLSPRARNEIQHQFNQDNQVQRSTRPPM